MAVADRGFLGAKITVVLAAILCAAGFVSGILDLFSFHQFKANASPVSATVIGITPEVHNTFSYSYTVGSHAYHGSGQIALQSIRPVVGANVEAFYDVRNPDYSELAPLGASQTGELLSRFVGVGLILPAILLIWAASLRARGRNSIDASTAK